MQKRLIYAGGWAGLLVIGILALTHIGSETGPGVKPVASRAVAQVTHASVGAASSVASSSSVVASVASPSALSAVSSSDVAATEVAVTDKPLSRAGRRCQERITGIMARRGVRYSFGIYELAPEGRRTMRQVYRELRRCRVPVRLTVAGYSDSFGPEDANQQISAGRAVAAMNALTALGWPDARVTAVGKGSIDPIASNRTFAGRKKNRRVVLTLVPAGA